MANTLSVDQVSTILRSVLAQATGQETLAGLDTTELLTIGQKALLTGAEPVMNAISQVISRTIFSIRPYNRKFADLERSETEWGNIVRKITVLDTPEDVQDNDYIPLTDGVAVDQYTVRKPKALQLNFYGQQTYEVVKTIFDTQLNTAFNSAEEFGEFISMVYTYVYNKIEKIHEETARATVAGFIAGKNAGDTSNVIHLLTEYNAQTGLALTASTVYQPDNFKGFMPWVYARVETISNLMTEYSINFHTNLTDGVIMRHTPREMQKLYIYAPTFYQTTNRVIADTYHDSFLTLPGAEMVNFWQDIDNPASIYTVASYLAADGTITTADSASEIDNVFGVIFDRDALGYNPVMERVKVTPYNARGEYRNVYWKFNERHYIDYTENGVVLLMD